MTDWCSCNKLKEAEEKAAKWDALAQTTHSCPCGARRTCRIDKWPLGIHADDGYADICSNCRTSIDESYYYCPNCGAKVVGE